MEPGSGRWREPHFLSLRWTTSTWCSHPSWRGGEPSEAVWATGTLLAGLAAACPGGGGRGHHVILEEEIQPPDLCCCQIGSVLCGQEEGSVIRARSGNGRKGMGSVRCMAGEENLRSDNLQVSSKNLRLGKIKFVHSGVRQTGLDDWFWHLRAL